MLEQRAALVNNQIDITEESHDDHKLFDTTPRAIRHEGCAVLHRAHLLLVDFIQTAHAATFTVTNTNDSGAGSLRAAITRRQRDGRPGC